MLNYEKLAFALREEYGCVYVEEMPRPYSDEDDAPKFWVTPEGLNFTVPMPDEEDGSYSEAVIAYLIKSIGLKKINKVLGQSTKTA